MQKKKIKIGHSVKARMSVFQKLKKSQPDFRSIHYDGELDLEFWSGERMNKHEFSIGTKTRKLMDTLEMVLDRECL